MVNFFRLLDSERHLVFCPTNFVADTYMGCPHGCWYCYGPASRRRGFKRSFEEFRHFKLRLTDKDIDNIGLACSDGNVDSLCVKKQEKLVAQALRRRFPLRIGSVSEPLGLPLEKNYRHTYKIIEKLGEHRYPYIICTKSPLVAAPEYVSLIKSTNGAVQVSLISTNEHLLQHIESRLGGHTPSASSRLKALKKLADEDVWTTCRIQPMIPRVTEGGMEDLIFALAEARVNHVIVEFMRIPQSHARGMSAKFKTILDEYCQAGGIVHDDLRKYDNDLYAFYKSFEDYEFAGGHLFFSKKEKARLMPQFADMVRKANKEFGTEMTFGSGDEETQYLNFTENCCGVDQLPGYSGYSTCTIQTMLKIAKDKGKVTLADMKRYYNPNMSKFEQVWKKKGKKGRYFIENRVFKLRARPTNDPSEVEYVYDEKAIPN